MAAASYWIIIRITSLFVHFILHLNSELPSLTLHNPVFLGRKKKPCYWRQIVRSYTCIPQCQNLISQVLIGQWGSDIQIDERAHGLSAASGISELQMWVNHLLSATSGQRGNLSAVIN